MNFDYICFTCVDMRAIHQEHEGCSSRSRELDLQIPGFLFAFSSQAEEEPGSGQHFFGTRSRSQG